MARIRPLSIRMNRGVREKQDSKTQDARFEDGTEEIRGRRSEAGGQRQKRGPERTGHGMALPGNSEHDRNCQASLTGRDACPKLLHACAAREAPQLLKIVLCGISTVSFGCSGISMYCCLVRSYSLLLPERYSLIRFMLPNSVAPPADWIAWYKVMPRR